MGVKGAALVAGMQERGEFNMGVMYVCKRLRAETADQR